MPAPCSKAWTRQGGWPRTDETHEDHTQPPIPSVAVDAVAVNDLPGGPAVRQLNLHPPVSMIAEQQAWLHWFMLVICVVIFVGVFGVMFYSILKHRKSVGHKAGQLPRERGGRDRLDGGAAASS
jgi:heme/copper-type cytochrome/quinol oxidase subunit 2